MPSVWRSTIACSRFGRIARAVNAAGGEAPQPVPSAGRKKTKLKVEQVQQVRQMAITIKKKQELLLY